MASPNPRHPSNKNPLLSHWTRKQWERTSRDACTIGRDCVFVCITYPFHSVFSHTTYQQLWIECEKEQCALLLLLLLLLSCDSEAHFHIPIRIVFLLFLISIRIDVCVCVCVVLCCAGKLQWACDGHRKLCIYSRDILPKRQFGFRFREPIVGRHASNSWNCLFLFFLKSSNRLEPLATLEIVAAAYNS